VLSVPEVMNHKQIEEREMVVEIDDKTIGKYRAVGNPMKLDQTPAQYLKGASALGEDNIAILKNIGLSDEDIDKLQKKAII